MVGFLTWNVGVFLESKRFVCSLHARCAFKSCIALGAILFQLGVSSAAFETKVVFLFNCNWSLLAIRRAKCLYQFLRLV